jgi:UDP-N-acetylglucosamine acyltransferase
VIHPTAIIHSKARLDSSVEVRPYAVIDEGVEIGAECVVGPHVYLTGRTIIGARNRFFAGCVIGEAPQDLKYRNEPTGVRIGEENVFREHVTVHRSSKVAEHTTIGSRNFLMQHSHVAHNVVLGDYVILAGGALLAGYARVEDRAFISGNCLVHQFVRVGTLALMQGRSGVSKDLPPFTVAYEVNKLCGLNVVGMRRAGMSAVERQELKQLYRALFREGKNLRDAMSAARKKFSSEPAKIMLDFIASSKRGICFDTDDRGEAASDEEKE